MHKRSPIHALISLVSILLTAPILMGTAAGAEVDLTFDHQDPSGDVMKYNATLDGVNAEDEPGVDSLDIKWVYTELDGRGNLVLTMDLKAKSKFLNENSAKYVFRLITTADDRTGYNITYSNGSCELAPFSAVGNGTSVDIMDKVSFEKDKGNEMLNIEVPVVEYLHNISYFNVDAYSMRVLDNATYLDYISELPGHPEYVDAGVEEEEELGDGGGSGAAVEAEEGDGISNSALVPVIIVLVLVFVLILVAVILKGRAGRS